MPIKFNINFFTRLWRKKEPFKCLGVVSGNKKCEKQCKFCNITYAPKK